MTGFTFNRKKKKSKKKKMAPLAPGELSRLNSKPVDNDMQKWRECNQGAATNNVVVKHIPNNVCSRQNWPHSCSQAWFSPSADQLNVSVKGQNPKRDPRYKAPEKSQAYPTRVPRQIAWSAVRQHSCCSKSCDTAASFTSDHLPQSGVILFDHALETSTAKHQASRCLDSSASAEESTNVPASRHIGEMLRQIRRELAVREPCRVEREAQKRVVDLADTETPQLAGGALSTDGEQGVAPIASASSSAGRSAPVSSHALYPDSDAGTSRAAPEKSAAFKTGREGPERCGVSSGFTGETGGPPSGKCAPADPDANLCNRIRIAHKPKQDSKVKQASSKLSWNGGKRKRPEEKTDIPR